MPDESRKTIPDTPTPTEPPSGQATQPAAPTTAQPAQTQPAAQNVSIPQPQPSPPFVLTQAGDFFMNGGFDRKIIDFQSYANRATGYKTLDRLQPFYPGFYVAGAIPSLGKTTFFGQMADQLAAAGHWVIYVSLEQTPFEIVSKSLARGFRRTNMVLAAQEQKPVDSYFAPSSIEIRSGVSAGCRPMLDAQIRNYVQHVGNRLCIVHGAFSLTVEDIIGIVDSVTEQIRKKPGSSPNETPILIVDYLQIIAPTMINGRIPDTKTGIDHIVHTLKAMQSGLDMTVLVISSLNRQNYVVPIDFESFKESGGIEYTADVIWGLQLSIMNQERFHVSIDKDGKRHGPTSLTEKRELINEAKRQPVRSIDLVCLKNRYGVANYTSRFKYSPRHDYFRPDFAPNDPDMYTPDIIPACLYQ